MSPLSGAQAFLSYDVFLTELLFCHTVRQFLGRVNICNVWKHLIRLRSGTLPFLCRRSVNWERQCQCHTAFSVMAAHSSRPNMVMTHKAYKSLPSYFSFQLIRKEYSLYQLLDLLHCRPTSPPTFHQILAQVFKCPVRSHHWQLWQL